MSSCPQARQRASSILMLVLLCATAGVAGAVQPPATPSLDVDRLSAAALSAADAVAASDALASSNAWLDWSRRHPAWRVAWNLRTRTAHRLYGPGVRLDVAAGDAAGVEAACRALLAESAPLTGVRADALRLAAADHRLGRWYVVFEQVEAGLPVRGGRADVRVTDTGAVQLFGADWHREPRIDHRPRIAAAAALAAAATDLGATTDFAHELVIVPEPHDAGYTYRLAHELRFRTAEPRGVWRAWVDAHSGDLLRRDNEIRYAQLTGRVTTQVDSTTIGDPIVSRPLRDTRFDVGTGMTESGFTDPDGLYDVTTAAVDSVDVRVRLFGRWGRVHNAQLGFVTPAILARMFPDTSHDFVWDDSNSRASERDAYYHALVAHQTIKDLDPAFTGVDYRMPITVDIFDRDCNAFYDGVGINFFGESMRCVNTARIADVVLHEYGHGITDWQYRPMAPSGAMHEAFSDYFAATIMNDPRIGRGFRGPGTIIRTVDNMNTFPDDVVGEVHRDGLILGGALWDLREALGAGVADTLFHFARYGRADNFDDYLLDVLVTDDDNGDIYDGTPRFDAVIAAFQAHGIGDYSVQIAHAPEPDTEDPNKPLRLTAVILSIFQLDTASLQLHYAVNGGSWNVLALAPTGMGVREFGATIPMQPAETQITYYITAADNSGHSASLPAAAAAAPFEFRVGTDITPPVIVHEALPDQPIDAPGGWQVQASVTDNLDKGLAAVQIGYFINGVDGGSLDLLPVGDDLYRRALPLLGAALGDSVSYSIGALDSAQTPNGASAPPIGTYRFDVVPGLARDLDVDDAGLTGTGDWEWGEPVAGPVAFTGTNVWGNGIQGNYTDDTESTLEIGPIDMTTWTRAALVFQHWLDCEPFWDGGCVEISTNAGLDWTLVEPSGGYPRPLVWSLANDGYSGDLEGWQRAEFELTQYAGQTVRLRWRFASDSGIVDRGWFIDDIEIVARQVLSIPLGLQAENGRDSVIPLSWFPPAGVDPSAPTTPLLGYNVYRDDDPELSAPVLLNAMPLPASAETYSDETAVNGVPFWYAVTALYADGESRRSTAAPGLAYVSAYSADAAALDVRVLDGAPTDTTITFTNTGTGFLEMNVWLGEATDTDIDQVRILYDRTPTAVARSATAVHPASATPPLVKGGAAPPPGPQTLAALALTWRRSERTPVAPSTATAPETGAGSAGAGGFTLLFSDTQEGGQAPDLKDLLVEANANGETRFRITAHAPWGNVLTDFTLVMGLDTDADRSTGPNGGFDYVLLVGAFPFATFGTPAIILQGQTQVTVPTHQLFPANSDVLEVGFLLDYIGNPDRLILQVLAFDPALQVPRDFAPNTPTTAAWLQPQAVHVSAPAGIPTALALSFPATVTPGVYAGKIFLETNAPAAPVVIIPVDYELNTTAVALTELTAVQEVADVVVRWRTSHEADVVAFRVHRAHDGGAFEALSPDVEPTARREYVFRDRDPQPGSYTYRIGEVAADGSIALHGAVEITTVRVAPAVSFLDPAVPNPFNPTTALRFGVAVAGPVEVAVFDTRGRRVRTLWRVAHAEPGFQRLTWDGRDDRGVRVASGVYHARLQTAARAFTRRLTLVK